jgi:hypothetical protein
MDNSVAFNNKIDYLLIVSVKNNGKLTFESRTQLDIFDLRFVNQVIHDVRKSILSKRQKYVVIMSATVTVYVNGAKGSEQMDLNEYYFPLCELCEVSVQGHTDTCDNCGRNSLCPSCCSFENSKYLCKRCKPNTTEKGIELL